MAEGWEGGGTGAGMGGGGAENGNGQEGDGREGATGGWEGDGQVGATGGGGCKLMVDRWIWIQEPTITYAAMCCILMQRTATSRYKYIYICTHIHKHIYYRMC